MEITRKNWMQYIQNLAKADDKAAELISDYLYDHEIGSDKGFNAFVDFFYSVVTKYAEGASEMAAQAYEALAEAQGATIKSAMPAETPSYGECKKAIRGTMLDSDQAKSLGQAAGRLVRRTGVDTTLNNALRDGAEWAWVPSGDTCAFCMMLASNGWQRASKKAIKNGHASHIHANCDCTYAIRFDGVSTVEGYDPDYYKALYDNAEGGKWQDKLNSMRRDKYAVNKDKINAQKRTAYANRNSYKEEGHKGKDRKKEIARSRIFSEDFGRRVSTIDENRNVTEIIKSEGRKILEHRNGTEFEDLIFINSQNGDYITRTDFDEPRRVGPSKKMLAMLREADDYTIVVVHNHSGSTVPSASDIYRLVERKHPYGVILCHNGDIYKYSCTKFNEPIYASAVAKLDRSGYNNKSIDEFAQEVKKAGVNIEVI